MVQSESIKFIDTKEKFEKVFRLYYADLCAFANVFLKDKDASEEIVQETFVKLWQKKSELKIKTSLKSYLYTSTRNSCLNLIKHIEIREDYKKHNQIEIDNSTQFGEEDILANELQQKIKESIDEMPEKRKQIFILSRYHGLKYREIAEKLDISVKTVENQMGSAMKFLREKLSNYLSLYIIILIELLSK